MKKDIYKKKIIIILICVVITLLILFISFYIRNKKINNQIISNINSDEKYTITYSNGKHIILNRNIYNRLKEENIDIIVSNDKYIARIESENINKSINLKVKIGKDKSFEKSISVHIHDKLSQLKINVSKYIKNINYVSQYNQDGLFLYNDISIDENGFCNISMNDNITKYIIAYIEPEDINVDDITINKGTCKMIDIGISPELYTVGSVKVECDDKEAVKIDDKLNLTANKVGEYKLVFNTINSSKEIKLTILQSAENIELDKSLIELTVGQSDKVNATVLPHDAVNSELVWTSSDENIACVSSDGEIKAISNGFCEISVSTKEEPIITQKIQINVNDNNINNNNSQTSGITYINGILLVNKNHTVPSDYSPGLQDEAYNAFLELKKDAANAGYNIELLSGFRSYETQRNLYNNYVAVYGQAEADTFSAKPGTSEHQTGLAMDVGWIDDSYGQTPSGIWLAENCYRYGFIIRYPKDKEGITGYKYEPWHIRYLGKEIAEDVFRSGLCLEEYLGVN